MNQDKLERLILRVKQIREEMMAIGPTNFSNVSSLGYDPENETPPVKKKKQLKYIYQDGLRKWWRSFNKNK